VLGCKNSPLSIKGIFGDYCVKKGNGNRETLRYFFSIVKNASNHIRFLLITCVSSFAEVGIFAELNHLMNITDCQEYTVLCDIAYLDRVN
jgi:hypothetical protein